MPTAHAAHLTADDRETRLVLDLTAPVEARAFALSEPDRIVLDLPEVNFQLGGAGAVGAGLVRSFRAGLFMAGRARVVIDLKQPASVVALRTETDEAGEASRLVVVLARADRARFAAEVAAARPAALDPSEPPLPATGDSRPVVVIDPGHGGIDPGATARNGLVEKEVVLELAFELKKRLEATGRLRVLMTRDRDVFVPLARRVRFAQEAGAAVMVSLHADSLPGSPRTRGAAVYVGSDTATDAESARLADKENRADDAAAHDQPGENDDVADILADLTQRETRLFATTFAKGVVEQLKRDVAVHRIPLRSARFRVLQSSSVPSVLVEAGYLSSAKDADDLASPKWRQSAAASITRAVEGFMRARGRLGLAGTVAP